MNRKTHNHDAGYIAERKNPYVNGKVVIYIAAQQKLDEGGGKYVVVCDAHHTLINTSNIPKARRLMKSVEFCEECMRTRATTSTPAQNDYGDGHCPRCGYYLKAPL